MHESGTFVKFKEGGVDLATSEVAPPLTPTI